MAEFQVDSINSVFTLVLIDKCQAYTIVQKQYTDPID